MINIQNKQFAHALPQASQGSQRLGVPTYQCSSSSDKVQFGGGSPTAPKFGADFKWDTEKFPPKRIFKFIGVGLMGIFGLHAGCHSYDINPNGTRSVVVRHGGNGPDKEVRGEGLVITFPPYMTTNVKYAINKQTVKETFQPLSRDGVRINGNGQNANTGVDIRLSFELDPGPDGKYDSVYQLNTKVLTSHPNLEYQNSSTAEFSTDDLITKALYFQEILPLLKNDIYTLSTVFPAEDFHNSRDFIQEGLKNGYRETIVEKDGTKREIEVKPLAAQLAPLGIKLNFVNVASIALPDFLKA
ncbi:MAG: hypothetical protein K2X66_18900, partial [Cyanobacteria bacterium]|nr:hypothetical protein [Cyanobacteriota bacterium]